MPLTSSPLSLRQLQYAVAVAETLSFRRAAALCRVAQPSLSAQLAALEETLGVRLFERDRRRVLLTAAGQELIARARRVLLEADDLMDAARACGDPLAGRLRVGIIPTLSPYLLPAAVPALRRAHPRLTLVWVEERTEVLRRELEAGRIDAELLALEADLGAVEHEVIAADPFVLATPPGHPLGRSSRPATAAELAGASVLLLDDGHCLREQALAVCADADAHELQFRATSLATLAQMVASGAGVTLLPALAVPTESRRASLRVRPFAAPAPHRTIVLAWRPRSPLGAALREVAATIRAAYPAAPGGRARGHGRGRAQGR
ncbi:MAG TPA: LysR substrate-binding domain-containing protein [Polyangia bacterium]|jgi:LysR family hydrogen peroxide-inducible transcriptional activator